MLIGVPQWFAVRAIQYGGTLNGTNEVDVCAANGFLNLGAGEGLEPSATHTITGGPTTTGPVIVQVQNTIWAIPFNVAAGAPDMVWQELKKTSDANAGGVWTWT